MSWDCCCGKIEDFKLVLNDLILTMTGGDGWVIDLSQFIDNTDAQEISLDPDGVTLRLSNGTEADTLVDLSPFLDDTNTTSAITNTVVGHRIATHDDGDGVSVDINETVTSIGYNNLTTVLTYTDENGNVTNADLSALASDIYVNGGTYDTASMILTLVDTNPATPDIVLDLSTLQSVVNNTVAGHTIATHDSGNGTTVDVQETITGLAYNDTTGTLTYSKEDGTQDVVELGVAVPVTTNVTEVLRSTLVIDPNNNINNNGNARSINGYTLGLDEIGVNTGGPSIIVPAGNYEVEALVNFEFDGGNPRTNFNLLLRQGNTVLQEAKGHNYMRNQNDHNEASQSTTFHVELATPTPLNIATQREASTGQTDITGGWVILRRYEQKSVLLGS